MHQSSLGSIFSKETCREQLASWAGKEAPGRPCLSVQMSKKQAKQPQDLIGSETVRSKCHSQSDSWQGLRKEEAIFYWKVIVQKKHWMGSPEAYRY